MDKFDKEILRSLQYDASITASELGTKIGLSQAAVWRRIHKLEEEGYIRKQVTLLNGDKLGCGTLVLAHVKLTAHGRAHFDEFTEKIKELPNVIECFVVLGDQDFFLKIVVKDVYEYEQFFFKKLSNIEGVAEIRSSVALSKIKNDTELPI
ncbi:MAG: Lrp/AsnC family transcriptional regulator [Gammaproteobacteria bacterium]|nr:Lrp/AsnC family transcriptional regulator [Gammaproteobacteria bacterium]